VRTLSVVAVATAALFLAGCGGGAGATNAAQTSQPSAAGSVAPPSDAPTPGGTAAPSASAPPAQSAAAAPIDIAAFDACALLTAEEIGKVIGDAVKPGAKRGSERTAGCQWDAIDPQLLKFVQVYVSEFSQENWDIGLMRADEELQGIGESAYRSESDIAPPGHLTIRHAGLLIDLVFFEDPPDKAKVFGQQEELGKLVVSRIT